MPRNEIPCCFQCKTNNVDRDSLCSCLPGHMENLYFCSIECHNAALQKATVEHVVKPMQTFCVNCCANKDRIEDDGGICPSCHRLLVAPREVNLSHVLMKLEQMRKQQQLENNDV